MNREKSTTMRSTDLEKVFSPQSVAVVGASPTPGKAGNSVVRHLLAGGFQGDVWPVNPRADRIEGLEAYPSLDALPGAPDAAFLSVPAGLTEEALEACARAGTSVVIVGASGFSELGTDEGRSLQERLLAIARASGMRLVGPNTNGAISVVDKAVLGFNSRFPDAMNRPGMVSLVSHSGALFDAVMLPLQRAGTGLARFIAVGNEADLTLAETVEWLAQDPHTGVIGLVVEALRDAERFRAAAEVAARNGKRIVALKVGRSAAGASAALAHSSRMAGSARAHEAFFRDTGVTTVKSVEALAGTLSLLALNPDWGGKFQPILCVTTSGAGGALIADAATETGLGLAGRPDGGWLAPARDALDALALPRQVRHPIDLGNLGDWSPLKPVLEALAPHEPGPVVAFSHTAPNETMSANLLDALRTRRASTAAPVMLLSPGGQPPELAAQYSEAGIPIFSDTNNLMRCLSDIFTTPKAARKTSVRTVLDPSQHANVRKLLDRARSDGEVTLNEADSTAIFAELGLPMADNLLATTPSEAADFAESLGFPVVLKAQVAGLAHKAAAGLVRLDVGDAASVEAAAREMAQSQAGGTPMTYLVQKMHRPVAEAMLAVICDAQLGPFLLFGPGGVEVEAIDAAQMLPVPASPERLRRMLEDTLLGEQIMRRLGTKSSDALDQIAATLGALGELALEQGAVLRAAEINPMIVTEDGRCVGVDGLIELAYEQVPE